MEEKYVFMAKVEIFIHKVLCYFGIHDYSDNSVLSFLESKIQHRDTTILSCFYCPKKINKVR